MGFPKIARLDAGRFISERFRHYRDRGVVVFRASLEGFERHRLTDLYGGDDGLIIGIGWGIHGKKKARLVPKSDIE